MMSEEEITAVIERVSKKDSYTSILENRLLSALLGVLIVVIGYFITTTISDIKTSIKDGNESVKKDIKDCSKKIDDLNIQCTSTQQQLVDHIQEDDKAHGK